MCGFAIVVGGIPTEDAARQAFGRIDYRGTERGSFSWRTPIPGLALATTLPRRGDRASPQPVVVDQRVVVLMNGEGYDLGSGGLSDTEALGIWLSRAGNGTLLCAPPIDEFAFASCDTATGTLVLGRDAFGSKPLFYGQSGARLAAASSARAVQLLLGLEPRLDIDSVRATVLFGPSVTPTIFHSVNEVPPGALLIFRQPSGRAELRLKTGRTARNRFEMLDRAVTRRVLPGDDATSYIAFSGGTDSSAIAKTEKGRDLTRATVLTESLGGSSRRRGAPRDVRVAVTATELAHNFGLLSRHLETPPASLTGAAFLGLHSEMSARGMLTAISGDGADELFCGYHYYRSHSGAKLHPILESLMMRRTLALSLLGVRVNVQEAVQQLRALDPRTTAVDPDAWREHDLSARLSRQLLAHNGDIPSLLARIELRLPFIDLYERRTVQAKYFSKHWMHARGSTRVEKRGFHVPAASLSTRQLRGVFCEVERSGGIEAVGACFGTPRFSAREVQRRAQQYSTRCGGPFQQWQRACLADLMVAMTVLSTERPCAVRFPVSWTAVTTVRDESTYKKQVFREL